MEDNRSTSSHAQSIDFQFLIQRAKEILITPAETWKKIREENTTISQELARYVVFMAAIPPLASWIGLSIIGVSLPYFGTIRQSLIWGFVAAVLTYFASLVLLYITSAIFTNLAIKFEGITNQTDIFKLLVFSCTPSWIASIALIMPSFGSIVLLAGGIYSIYLFFSNLNSITTVNNEKRLPYFGASIGISILVSIVIFGVVNFFSNKVLGNSIPAFTNSTYDYGNISPADIGNTLREIQKNMPQP